VRARNRPPPALRATHALLLGGNVRVGLEDAVWYDKRTLATSNAQLVARVARVSRELGRPRWRRPPRRGSSSGSHRAGPGCRR